MKKKHLVWLLAMLAVFLLSACQNKTDQIPTEEKSTNRNVETGEIQKQNLIVSVGGQRFQTTLYDNETAQAFMERLPMTINMEELHGNEKYVYLDEGLPRNSENIDRIQTGDLMLFGSDCLVLFFEDFSNSYSYTRIGHIEDVEGFANALEDGTVEVSFEAGK